MNEFENGFWWRGFCLSLLQRSARPPVCAPPRLIELPTVEEEIPKLRAIVGDCAAASGTDDSRSVCFGHQFNLYQTPAVPHHCADPGVSCALTEPRLKGATNLPHTAMCGKGSAFNHVLRN